MVRGLALSALLAPALAQGQWTLTLLDPAVYPKALCLDVSLAHAPAKNKRRRPGLGPGGKGDGRTRTLTPNLNRANPS